MKGIARSQRVFINEEECIGCGTCSELCPEIFRMNEKKEKAEVIKPEGGSFDCLTEAMEGCPVSCIHWDE